MSKNNMLKIFISLILLCSALCSSAFAERLSVNSKANIRSGPDSSSGIIWEAEKYYPLEVIKKQNSWYNIRDFEKDKGWIHQSLVGNTPSVITKKETNNIRKGPGPEYDIYFSVEKGIPFKVLEKKGRWLHIEHSDGDKGWIHDSLVW